MLPWASLSNGVKCWASLRRAPNKQSWVCGAGGWKKSRKQRPQCHQRLDMQAASAPQAVELAGRFRASPRVPCRRWSAPPERNREADCGGLDVVPPAGRDEEHLAGLQHTVCMRVLVGLGRAPRVSRGNAKKIFCRHSGAAQQAGQHTPPCLNLQACCRMEQGTPERGCPTPRAPGKRCLALEGRGGEQRVAFMVGRVHIHLHATSARVKVLLRSSPGWASQAGKQRQWCICSSERPRSAGSARTECGRPAATKPT